MKQLLLVAIVLLSISTSNAQEIKLGAKAGVNLSTIEGDFTQNIESYTGFHLGGFAEVVISEKFSFQPELLFSAQGYNESSFDSGFNFSRDYKAEVRANYLNMPLMAKYYVTDGLSIEAGPYVGVLLSSNIEGRLNQTFDGETEITLINEDYSDELNTIDYGVGAGVSYKMSNGINFSARYNLGLSNTEGRFEDQIKQQNQVIQISVGYFFN